MKMDSSKFYFWISFVLGWSYNFVESQAPQYDYHHGPQMPAMPTPPQPPVPPMAHHQPALHPAQDFHQTNLVHSSGVDLNVPQSNAVNHHDPNYQQPYHGGPADLSLPQQPIPSAPPMGPPMGNSLGSMLDLSLPAGGSFGGRVNPQPMGRGLGAMIATQATPYSGAGIGAGLDLSVPQYQHQQPIPSAPPIYQQPTSVHSALKTFQQKQKEAQQAQLLLKKQLYLQRLRQQQQQRQQQQGGLQLTAAERQAILRQRNLRQTAALRQRQALVLRQQNARRQRAQRQSSFSARRSSFPMMGGFTRYDNGLDALLRSGNRQGTVMVMAAEELGCKTLNDAYGMDHAQYMPSTCTKMSSCSGLIDVPGIVKPKQIGQVCMCCPPHVSAMTIKSAAPTLGMHRYREKLRSWDTPSTPDLPSRSDMRKQMQRLQTQMRLLEGGM